MKKVHASEDAEAVADEIARHVARLAAKRDLDPALLFAALQVMPIDWKAASEYEDHRAEAEQRIATRDPDDWPTAHSRSSSPPHLDPRQGSHRRPHRGLHDRRPARRATRRRARRVGRRDRSA
ncbi:MAG: PIN domain-containing protein [Solirubrobacterales bacterium]